MTVTIDTPVQVGQSSWRLTYSSTESSPTYYIYQDGSLLATTTQASWVFWLPAGESLMVEIFDDADAVATNAYPSRVTLHWYAPASVDYYRIDKYADAAWSEVGRVFDTGAPYYSWKTAVLSDVTSYTYRIVSIGDNGNEGAYREFTFLMVKHPAEPDVTYTYASGTAKVTVAEA